MDSDEDIENLVKNFDLNSDQKQAIGKFITKKIDTFLEEKLDNNINLGKLTQLKDELEKLKMHLNRYGKKGDN